MRCEAQYRPMDWRRRNLWSVACICGWICDHPIRGEQEKAREAWRTHRAEVETAALEKSMRHIPRGVK